jgi:hypothetical protein
MTETDTVVNRHMARILADLEDAGCPVVFRDAVKTKLVWLRSDLNAMKERAPTDVKRLQNTKLG